MLSTLAQMTFNWFRAVGSVYGVHRRRSSVNFGGARHFCPKIYAWKINKMSEFYMTYTQKITKMSEFYVIFCPKNIFFGILGGKCPLPLSPMPMMGYSLPFSQSVKSNLRFGRRLSVLCSFLWFSFLYVRYVCLLCFFKFTYMFAYILFLLCCVTHVM